MAIKAKELRHKAKQNQTRMQAILESSAEKLSAEQEKEFDALDKDAEEYLRQADKIERVEKMSIANETSEEIVQPRGTKMENLKEEEKAKLEDLAMRSYLRTGVVPKELHHFMAPGQAEEDDNSHIKAALKSYGIDMATQTTTATAGGYTIARGFQRELEKALKAYGGMWENSRIIRTSKGNILDWPTVNDTNRKAYLIAESTSAATSAQAVVFGQQQFEAYKYTSGLIQVPYELIEDSEFNIGAELVTMLSERMWRGTNYDFTLADGSSKPKGITVAAAYGGSTADDQALAYDDFVKLEHNVDPLYRKGAKFMFHDTVLREIKKLKDSTGQPLWTPYIMRDGEPARFMGYQYVINQDMASWSVPVSSSNNDSKKIALFGDLSKYIIRQVNDMRIVRLNERYGELDQVAFVVFMRVDGDLLNAGTNPVKYLKVSTT